LQVRLECPDHRIQSIEDGIAGGERRVGQDGSADLGQLLSGKILVVQGDRYYRFSRNQLKGFDLFL
jgi:hypothetical protein